MGSKVMGIEVMDDERVDGLEAGGVSESLIFLTFLCFYLISAVSPSKTSGEKKSVEAETKEPLWWREEKREREQKRKNNFGQLGSRLRQDALRA